MDNRINEIRSQEELNSLLNKESNRSVFLGNGFNIALRIQTSYQSLFNSLMTHNFVKGVISQELYNTIVSNRYNFEAYKDEIKNDELRNAVLTKFYEIILNKCKARYKYKEVVSFLLKFSKFFTINYDPLLYRFCFNLKKEVLMSKMDFIEI